MHKYCVLGAAPNPDHECDDDCSGEKDGDYCSPAVGLRDIMRRETWGVGNANRIIIRSFSSKERGYEELIRYFMFVAFSAEFSNPLRACGTNAKE